MKTKGISFALILLVGSLVVPMTFSEAEVSSVPLAPTSLSTTSVSSSKINLSWTAPINATISQVNGYKIEIDTGCFSTFSALVANTTNTSTTYSSTGLISGLCYQYKVSALNSVGPSTPSNVASATTWSVPSIPTNLNANAVSSSQINLSWLASSSSGGTPITGYKIQRNGTTLVNDTGTTITNYANTGLFASHQQTYRVAAWNSVGLGPYTVNVTGTTNSPPPTLKVPNAPTALSVTALSNSSLKLSWTAPSDNGGTPITGYKIQRNGTTLVNNTGSAQTNYTNTGLFASHKQTYRVAAWNSVGLGPYSNNSTDKTMNQTSSSSSIIENLGQMVSEFVHRYNTIFKEQREATVKAIKECNQKVMDASPENRKQVKSDCKSILSAIREKYKDERRQFQIEFKHFKETAKAELKIARESASITKSDIKEFQSDLNHAKNETKKIETESKKELKHQEKELKKEIKGNSKKDKPHKEDD